MTKYYQQFCIAAFSLVVAEDIFEASGNALDAMILADTEMHIGLGAEFPGIVKGRACIR